jgi:transcriptional regulator with GAF, ATPase, and Fis domain
MLRLPERLVASTPGMTTDEYSGSKHLATLEEMERRHIQSALRRAGGRVGGPGGAAEILDIHPNTLRSRMKKLGIHGARSNAENGENPSA